MKTRIKRFAVVQPVGHKPYRDRAELHYRDNAELRAQLSTFCRSKWATAKKIEIDVTTQQVLIDGTHRANYSVHEHRA